MSQTNTSPAGGRTHSRKRVIHLERPDGQPRHVKLQELTGYALVNELRRVADDTANPERADLMMRAAAEIEQLIEELRKEERKPARLNHAEEK
jgi:hypothetical protein